MDDKSLQVIDERVQTWLRTLDEMIPNLVKDMQLSTKQNRYDLVTNVDRTIQNDFESFLHEHCPQHQLLAEEKSNEDINPKRGHTWVMDPIDGTMNLVKQQEDYCIILAYFIDGQPMLSYIYDYPRQQLYHAKRGSGAYVNGKKLPTPPHIPLQEGILSFGAQFVNAETLNDLFEAAFSYRSIGACGLDSIRVIKGQFAAHFNTNPKPWDIAAQFLFAEELGLRMTTLDGEEIDFTKAGPFIISNSGCHQEVLDILNSKGGYI
ncbi:inositol monophosphatase family protein [Staphylococcus sp. SQ8-PEA]|uniref:Inositol monophosphatase family protein n=1 Tax=Staphylococcus marylandisciuri TaxID=2981529 RepID=A0ABT2QML6_9STAP|nr:inositol monophosphatase family protein [Staphylococcus marylandisciuri]MCU5745215.1 inositol monophosphatase family protein [Staphylococcus marylandisciuri]